MTERSWDWIDQDRVHDAVEKFASSWSVRFGSVDDARHEAMAHIAEHPWIIGSEDTGSGFVYLRLSQSMWRKLKNTIPEPSEAHVGGEAIEADIEAAPGTYTVEQVARLARACFSIEDLTSLRNPFGDVPRAEVARFSAKDPSHANTLWAEVADVRKAFSYQDGKVLSNKAHLTHDEQSALLCRFALDMTKPMAQYHGVRHELADRAVMKMVNYLNGG